MTYGDKGDYYNWIVVSSTNTLDRFRDLIDQKCVELNHDFYIKFPKSSVTSLREITRDKKLWKGNT
jgi:hypothetical protein